MGLFSFLINYFIWHYTKALLDVFFIWKNFLFFVLEYFSVKILLFSLFHPWRRLGGEKKKFFDPGFIIINTLMRVVGFGIRISTIFIGLVSFVFCFALGFIFILLWLFLPVILISLFSAGIYLIFYK